VELHLCSPICLHGKDRENFTGEQKENPKNILERKVKDCNDAVRVEVQ
jgi:hypothetical protein